MVSPSAVVNNIGATTKTDSSPEKDNAVADGVVSDR